MDNNFADHFERDLLKLKEELIKFKDEANIWRGTAGITNSAGTLTLHLLGNLHFTIGAQLGGTSYERNREEEFSLTGIPREKLVADIESLLLTIKSSLADKSPSQLGEKYAIDRFGENSTAWYLTFFYGHFAYHLGQINYLRRILEP